MRIIKEIKIHGLMRSGTNFLEFLIFNNFKVEPLVNEFAWKHGPINENKDFYVIISYKNIFSWLYSLYNYALNTKFFNVEKNTSFSSFIENKLIFKEREISLEEDNPIALYNKIHSSWFNSKNSKVFINYEDLLLNTQQKIYKLANFLNLPKPNKIFYPSENILPGQSKKVSKVESPFYDKVNFYKKKIYMKNFSSNDLNFIEKELDKNLFTEIQKSSI